jgi:hypothetical protein
MAFEKGDRRSLGFGNREVAARLRRMNAQRKLHAMKSPSSLEFVYWNMWLSA